ncbi:unnamed protein product [Durusdinium trenchii]|uniref:Uncharacterized protein n=2 Tax=Durusdinium trenchii TaxID=1381693 RepID=A0ABP0NVE8_9DINO
MAAESSTARRNFRISPMPLSALAVIETELLALGGHDNAVSLYSTSCGSSLSRSSMHADTVTCLGAARCKSDGIVSGSRDQSVVTWAVTPSGLKSEVIFDDLQQPVLSCACSGSLVLATAADQQLICWDKRSGQPILQRETLDLTSVWVRMASRVWAAPMRPLWTMLGSFGCGTCANAAKV